MSSKSGKFKHKMLITCILCMLFALFTGAMTVSLALFRSDDSKVQTNSFGAVVLGGDNASYTYKSKITSDMIGESYLFNDIKFTASQNLYVRAHVKFTGSSKSDGVNNAVNKLKYNSFEVEDQSNCSWVQNGDYWNLCTKGTSTLKKLTSSTEVHTFLKTDNAIVPDLSGDLSEGDYVVCEITLQSSSSTTFESIDKETEKGTFTVTFKQGETTLSTKTASYGKSVEAPTNYSKEDGEKFECWNTMSNGKGADIYQVGSQITNVTQNLTLYPKFVVEQIGVTVKWSGNGSVSSPSGIVETNGSTLLVDYNDDLLLRFSPDSGSHVQQVTKKVGETTVSLGALTEYLLTYVTQAVTIDVQFEVGKIVLDINDGSGTQPNVVYSSDQSRFMIEEGTEPTKSGKTFYYYSTNKTDSEQGQNGTRYDLGRWYDIPEGDSTTLYAIYLTPTTNYTTAQAYIVIPTTVTSIANYALTSANMFGASNATVKYITLPRQTKTIGNCAFANLTGLTGVSMSDNVTTLGSYVFYKDSALKKFIAPQDLTAIGGYTFQGCTSLASVTNLEDIQITGIPSYCFAGCSALTTITLPKTVTTIGECAFSGAGLKSLNLVNTNLDSIGVNAFKDCASLTSVTLPSTLGTIGAGAFSTSGLVSLDFSSTGVKTIAGSTFAYCSSLTNITIPVGLTSIGTYAFYVCNKLTSIIGLSNSSVQTIGESAFSGCSNLSSVVMPSLLTTIGASAFRSCTSLSGVTLNNKLGSMGEYVFSGCTSLVGINLENTALTTISANAFSGCSNLVAVTIPKGITTIGIDAFKNCSGLKTLTFNKQDSALKLTVGSTDEPAAFSGTTSDLDVYVDSNMLDDYITALNGKGFANNAEMYFIDGIDCVAIYNNGAWIKIQYATITSAAVRHDTMTFASGAYLDTGVKFNYAKSMKVSGMFKLPTLGKRYLTLGLWSVDTCHCAQPEITTDNVLRIYSDISSTSNVYGTKELSANTWYSYVFDYNSTTGVVKYTVYEMNGNTLDEVSLTINNKSVTSTNGLRVGTADHRGYSAFNPISLGMMVVEQEGVVRRFVPTSETTWTDEVEGKEYTITGTGTYEKTGGNGIISPAGENVYKYGLSYPSQEYTITPNVGSYISCIFVDGVPQKVTAKAGESQTYTFEGIKADHTIFATFKINTFTITATSGVTIDHLAKPTTGTGMGSGSDATGTYFTKDSTAAWYAGLGCAQYYGKSGVTYIWTFEVYHTMGKAIMVSFDANVSSSSTSGNDAAYGGSNVSSPGSIPSGVWTTLSLQVTLIDGLTDPFLHHTFCPQKYTDKTAFETAAKIYYRNSQITIIGDEVEGGQITDREVTEDEVISLIGKKTYNYGETQQYVITPEEGYEISSVKVDGTEQLTSNVSSYSWTFSNITKDHTIFAAFKKKTFTITSSAGEGGTISPSGEKTYDWGTEAATYTIKPNTNYEISSVLVDGVEQLTSNVSSYSYKFEKIQDNHVIVAYFASLSRTLTYDANGGQFSDGNTTKTKSYDNYKSDTAKIDTENDAGTPTRTGFEFLGWSKSSTSSEGQQWSDKAYSDMFGAENGYLYAIWKQTIYNVSVTFAEGSSGLGSISGTGTYPAGTTAKVTVAPNKGYKISNITDNGSSVLSSWTASGDVRSYEFKNISADHEIIVTIEANTYTVTFDKNGGDDVSTSSITVTYGQKYGTLPTATKANYTYEWYTAKTGGSLVTSDTIVMTAGDHKLYAHWRGDTYTVTFDPNGGSVSTTSKEVIYESTYDALPTPTRSGYVFAGWSKNLFNPEMATDYVGCTRNGETFTFDTGTTNQSSYSFQVQTWNGSTYLTTILSTSTTGKCSVVLTKTSSITRLRIKYNGDKADAQFYYDISYLPDGKYVIQANVTTMKLNKIVVKDIMIEQNANDTKSDYVSCSNYIIKNSIVSSSCDHTLYAHWIVGNGVLSKNWKTKLAANGFDRTKLTTVSCLKVLPTTMSGWINFSVGSATLDGTTNWSSGKFCDVTMYVSSDGTHAYIYCPGEKLFLPTDSQELFLGMSSLISIDLSCLYDGSSGSNTGKVDTSNVTTMGYMFDGCTNLKELNISNFNFSSCSSIISMFNYCSNLTTIRCSNLTGLKSSYGSNSLPGSFGWYSDVDLKDGTPNTKITEINSSLGSSVSYLYRAYQITYNNNGGSGSMSASINTYYSPLIALTTNTFTRTGYTFSGWAKTSSGSVAYTNGAKPSESTVFTGDKLTLYAVWTANTYTVTFDKNGGDSVSTSSKEVTYDQKYGTLPTPTRAGYTFAGWSNSMFDMGAWLDNYIYYKRSVSGGTATYDRTNLSLSITPNSGSKDTYTTTYTNAEKDYTVSVKPSTKYVFSWTQNVQAAPSVMIFFRDKETSTWTSTMGSARDGELYDASTLRYYKTFTTNSTTTCLSVRFGMTNTTAITFSKVKLEEASSDMPTAFLNNVTSGTIVTTASDHTLYANWTANTYSVSFNKNAPNGATPTGTMSNQSFTYDIAQNLTTNAYVCVGYTFAGWGTSASGSVVYSNGQSVKNLKTSGTFTLYAKWTANTIKITLDNQGATSAGTTAIYYKYGTSTYYSNEACTSTYKIESITVPQKTGHTFGGYKTNYGGLITYIGSDGKPTNDLYSAITASTTLYANWTANTYTITLDSGTCDTVGSLSKTSYTYSSTNDTTVTITLPKRTGYSLTLSAYFIDATPVTGSSLPTFSSDYKTMTIKAGTGGNLQISTTWIASPYTITWNASANTASVNAQYWNYAGSTGYTSSNTGSYSKYSFSSKTATSSVTYDSTLGYYAPIPLRAGYTFNGWYTSYSGGTKVADASGSLAASVSGYTDSSKQWINASSVTLYAQWSKTSYSISYTLNGGTNGSTAPSSYNYSSTTTISDPERKGYTFTGWTVKSTLTKKQYGTINLSNGYMEYSSSYPNAVYFQMIYLKSGTSYTSIVSDVNSEIRWRGYNTSGAYTGGVSSSTTYTPSSDQYAMIWYHGGMNATSTTITWNGGTSFSLANVTGDLTLTANWTANTIKVTLDKQNGSGGTSEFWYKCGTERYYSNEDCTEKITKITIPTRTGYIFAQYWSTTELTGGTPYINKSGEFGSGLYGHTSSFTLYAHWTPITYTITLNANGGTISNLAIASGSSGLFIKTKNSQLTATYASTGKFTATMSKTGYTFNGWTNSGTGTVTDNATLPTNSPNTSVLNLTSSADGTVTLTANWMPNIHSVSFTSGTTDTVSGLQSKIYFKYGDTTKTFYTNEDCTTKLTNNKIAIPQRTGYTFQRYFESSGFHVCFTSSGAYNAEDEQSDIFNNDEDFSFTAGWTLNTSTIKLGTLTNVSKVYYGTSSSSITTQLTTSGFTANANTNYYFKAVCETATGYTITFSKWSGWFSDTTSTSSAHSFTSNGQTYTVNALATKTANTYTVYAYPNGGAYPGTPGDGWSWDLPNKTGAYVQKDVTYDSTYGTMPTDPTRTGYTFAGWWTAASGGTQVTATTKVTTAGAHSIYAHWTPITYTITLNANGGSISGLDIASDSLGLSIKTANSQLTATYASTGKFTATMSRTGYTFNGWTNSGSGTVTDNTTLPTNSPNTSVLNLTSTNGGTVTLTAKWQPITYYIYLNQGSGSGASVSYVYYKYMTKAYYTNSSCTTSLGTSITTPSRTGYTFGGYRNSTYYSTYSRDLFVGESLNQDDYETLYQYAGNRTFTAQWTAIQYTIDYSNYYSHGANHPTSANYGDVVTISKPSRDGYDFAGWTASGLNTSTAKYGTSNGSVSTSWSSGSTAVGGNYTTFYFKNLCSTSRTVTLTATWTNKIITITLNNQGATSAGTTAIYYKYSNATYYTDSSCTTSLGTSITTPSRTGYTFKGYFTSTGGLGTQHITAAGEVTNRLYMTSSDTTLYAAWAKNSWSTLELYNGSSLYGTYYYVYGGGGQDIIYTKAPTTNGEPDFASANGVQYGDVGKPTKTGYTFNGFYTASSGGIQLISSSGYASDSLVNYPGVDGVLKLYAQWSINTYVTFNANGGSVSTSSKTVTYDQTYGDLPTPTRTGYTFAGWWTAASGGTQVTSSTTVSITSAQTLYAHWTANIYKVTLDQNDGTGGTSAFWYKYGSSTMYSDSSCSTKLNTNGEAITIPTKVGYTFDGYYDKEWEQYMFIDETGMAYSVDENYWEISYDIELIANWMANTYTVTYNANGGYIIGSEIELTSSTIFDEDSVSAKSSLSAGYYLLTLEQPESWEGWTTFAVEVGDDDAVFIYSFDAYYDQTNTFRFYYNGNADGSLYIEIYWTETDQDQTRMIVSLHELDSLSTSSVEFGSTYGTLSTPTRSGYAFAGWWTAASGGTQVTSSTTVSNPSDHCIYAQWNAIFETNDTGETIKGLTEYGAGLEIIDIPSEIDGTTITAIGDEAFSGNTTMTSLTIPSTITSIGTSAFKNCSGLTSIKFNATNCADLTSSSKVFYQAGSSSGCTVTFGSGVTKIPAYLFHTSSTSYAPKIKSVTIPSTVKTIGNYAFYDCSTLTTVTFSGKSTLKLIGSYAFRSCAGLTSITIPEGVTSISGYAFRYCTKLTSISLPSTLLGMRSYAFANCTQLSSVTFSGTSTLTGIGDHAFYNCTKLTSISLPSSTITIQNNVFGNCTGLTQVYIPSSVTTISVSSVSNSPFYSCSSSLEIYCGASSKPRGWGDYWNYYASGSQLTVYWDCDTFEYLREGDFYDEFGGGMITELTDAGKSRTILNIPQGTRGIGPNAFLDCTNLQYVFIPDSVIYIKASSPEYSPFYGCSSSLKVVCWATSKPSAWEPSFRCISSNSTISYWYYGTEILATDGAGTITEKGEYYNNFFGSSYCTICYLPSSIGGVAITAIGNNALSANSGVSFIIPEGITSIETYAFYYDSPTFVVIPSTVTEIGDHAFGNCSSLTTVFYGGTEEEWEAITVGSDNTYLTNASIYFYGEWEYVDGIPTEL